MIVVDSIQCACSDTTGNATLSELRTRLALRMGYGAHATLPPHMADLFDDFLIQSQKITYKRLQKAGLRTERWFSWPLTEGEALYDLPDNAEGEDIATPTGLASSTSATGGSLAASTYYYRVSAINRNGETLACAEVARATSGATSTVTLTWTAVEGATGYKVYGRATGAELYMATVTDPTWTDDGSLTPAGALPAANTTACTKTIDPRAILGVFTVIDGVWTRLTHGIPDLARSDSLTGRPTRYELRQCFEVWPAPSETNGDLVVKGHFNLEPFASDDDVTTIDDELVFLLALANAKAHAGKPDAPNYVSQYESYLGETIAGAHGTRRYIPGRREECVYTPPMPTVPFDP